MLHIYTDGSALDNGKDGPGGFGVAIFDQNNNLIYSYNEQFEKVTNNQMELKAILKAFELLDSKYKNQKATIYSDSSYCINILTSWIFDWSNNYWRNKQNKPIKNLDIILLLYEYYKKDFFICQIDFVKVKGHNGNLGNELADALASNNISKFKKIILDNHINIIL